MPYIGNTPALDYISYAVQNFTVTAGTTVYTLDYSVANENDIRLVINNVIQRPGALYAYSATGTTLTLTSATLSTDTMYAVFIGRAVQTVTPPANINIQLADGTAAAPSLNFANDTNTGIFRPTADTIAFTEGGTESMRIDSSGRLLVGTTATNITSSEKFEVNGNGAFLVSSTTIPALYLQNSDSTANTNQPYLYFSDGSANRGSLGLNYTNNTLFLNGQSGINFRYGGTGLGTTEAMRIDSSGNVGIGETSISSKLHIKSDGSVNACARMNNTEAGTGTSNTVIFQRNGTNIGFITATGSATGYVTSSDYRLKENVNYDFDAITRLKQLKPARFNFIIEPNKTVDGFLAHEVQEVVPEAIYGNKDEVDNEGNIVSQGIDQSKLVPLLTGALKQAIIKIEKLEATLTYQQYKIDALEARLTTLESK